MKYRVNYIIGRKREELEERKAEKLIKYIITTNKLQFMDYI